MTPQPGGSMWRLMMTNPAKEWVEAGTFETVTAAAGRIRELEDYPVTGVFLQMHIDTLHGTDEESFGHLEHTGQRALYVVKRRVN
jgi:hypothetical protein